MLAGRPQPIGWGDPRVGGGILTSSPHPWPRRTILDQVSYCRARVELSGGPELLRQGERHTRPGQTLTYRAQPPVCPDQTIPRHNQTIPPQGETIPPQCGLSHFRGVIKRYRHRDKRYRHRAERYRHSGDLVVFRAISNDTATENETATERNETATRVDLVVSRAQFKTIIGGQTNDTATGRT